MEARVRSALLGALGAALAACGSTAPQPDVPQRPGLPAFWESQVTEESEPQAPETPQTPRAPQTPADTPEPGTYYKNWPDVSGAGAAGTEEALPFRVGPTPPPAGPDAQRPQQLIESDTPAGPPY